MRDRIHRALGRFRAPAALVVAIVVCTTSIRLAVFDRRAPEVVRGGRVFTVAPVPSGTTFSQVFDARGGTLEVLRFDAEISGTEAWRHVDATLSDVSNPDVERSIGSIAVEQTAECCTLRFTPIQSHLDKKYRLDMTVRDLPESARLSIVATTAQHRSGVTFEGGLSINGHIQRANLMLSSDSAPIRLPDVPFNPLLLLVSFVLMDAAIVFVVYTLFTSSDLRRP